MITIEQRDLMKSGVRLCRQSGEAGDEFFFSDPSCDAPRPSSIAALCSMGVIAEAEDGLFEGHSQTYDLIFDPKSH